MLVRIKRRVLVVRAHHLLDLFDRQFVPRVADERQVLVGRLACRCITELLLNVPGPWIIVTGVGNRLAAKDLPKVVVPIEGRVELFLINQFLQVG